MSHMVNFMDIGYRAVYSVFWLRRPDKRCEASPQAESGLHSQIGPLQGLSCPPLCLDGASCQPTHWDLALGPRATSCLAPCAEIKAPDPCTAPALSHVLGLEPQGFALPVCWDHINHTVSVVIWCRRPWR